MFHFFKNIFGLTKDRAEKHELGSMIFRKNQELLHRFGDKGPPDILDKFSYYTRPLVSFLTEHEFDMDGFVEESLTWSRDLSLEEAKTLLDWAKEPFYLPHFDVRMDDYNEAVSYVFFCVAEAADTHEEIPYYKLIEPFFEDEKLFDKGLEALGVLGDPRTIGYLEKCIGSHREETARLMIDTAISISAEESLSFLERLKDFWPKHKDILKQINQAQAEIKKWLGDNV
ncbi:MAG: hypothetical protein OEZ36_13960 [Spirochaetota bacterium]|nr:hypothetical protein [Spirochaetota bacterium]